MGDRSKALRRLVETANYVKLQSGRPEIADWARRLDRARRGLLAVLPAVAATPDQCLGPVVENGREVVAVSQEIFTANSPTCRSRRRLDWTPRRTPEYPSRSRFRSA